LLLDDIIVLDVLIYLRSEHGWSILFCSRFLGLGINCTVEYAVGFLEGINILANENNEPEVPTFEILILTWWPNQNMLGYNSLFEWLS